MKAYLAFSLFRTLIPQENLLKMALIENLSKSSRKGLVASSKKTFTGFTISRVAVCALMKMYRGVVNADSHIKTKAICWETLRNGLNLLRTINSCNISLTVLIKYLKYSEKIKSMNSKLNKKLWNRLMLRRILDLEYKNLWSYIANVLSRFSSCVINCKLMEICPTFYKLGTIYLPLLEIPRCLQNVWTHFTRPHAEFWGQRQRIIVFFFSFANLLNKEQCSSVRCWWKWDLGCL